MPPERYGPPGPRGDYQEGGGPGGMLQQGAVLMIYGLTEKMNCQRIFNLFCLYGNVVRVSVRNIFQNILIFIIQSNFNNSL